MAEKSKGGRITTHDKAGTKVPAKTVVIKEDRSRAQGNVQKSDKSKGESTGNTGPRLKSGD